MVRKIATQVPASVSRLIQSTQLKTPPTWYAAVLANPPPVLPARQVVARSRPGAARKYDDLPPSHADERREGHTRTHHLKQYREPKPRPVSIMYDADRIRRQFFADFPFEALRPVSLVEAGTIAEEHPIRGKEWTSLAQRGRYPTVEDTVAFTLTLQKDHGIALSEAYARATAEFAELRGKHEMATLAAAAEARHFGATFKRDEWQRSFDLETSNLDKGAIKTHFSSGSASAAKSRNAGNWTAALNPASIPSGEFTGGRSYVQKWVLPTAANAGVAEGDLVSAIGSATASGPASEQGSEQAATTKADEEMDDLELMAKILGEAKPRA